MKLRELTQNGKVASFALGRMNPATIGHERLVDAVKEAPGDHFLFLTDRPAKLPDNPLTPQEKLDWARKSFNGIAIGLAKTVLTAADRLYKMGYTEVTFLEGEDKLFNLLNQYNGVPQKMHDYNFSKINYVRLERDEDAVDAKGMSGTKLRGHVVNNDLEKFKEGVTQNAQPYAEDMFKKLQGILGVDPVGETVEEGWFGFGDPELLPEPEWLDAENKQLWAQKQPNEDDDRFVIQLRNYTTMADNHLIDDANMGLRGELENLKRNVTEASPTVPEKIEPFEVPEPPKAPDSTIPRRRNGYTANDGTIYTQDPYNENIMTVQTDRGEFVFDDARLIKWTSPIPQYRQVHDFVRRTITVKTNTIADTGDGEVVIKQDSVYDLDGNLKDSGNTNYSAGGLSVTTGSDGAEIRYNIGQLEIRMESNPTKARNMNRDPSDLRGIADKIAPLFQNKEIVKAYNTASQFADVTLLWNGRAKHPREVQTLMQQQDG